MKKPFLLVLLSIILVSCQLIIPPTPIVATQQQMKATETVTPSATPRRFATQTIAPTLASFRPPTLTIVPGELASLVDLTANEFATTDMVGWKSGQTTEADYQIPVDWNVVANKGVTAGLTFTQQEYLIKNGFVIIHSQEDQFSEIRSRVSERYGQPYFLTTDAAVHALHLHYLELVRALELEELRPRLVTITQALLTEVLSYYPLVQGTELEQDTLLAAAYLSVGLKLLDSQLELDPLVKSRVMDQVEGILAGEGDRESQLIPDFSENFAVYIPTGHYKGDPALDSYFRAMTWFGRPQFKINGSNLNYEPSRAPLILTLALRHARVEGILVANIWAAVQDTLDYIFGPSTNIGPSEYSVLMDQVYGNRGTIISLQNNDMWRTFLAISLGLPSLQSNSSLMASLTDPADKQGWSLMGYHQNPDDLILQNLLFNNVGTTALPRDLPSGLDIMALLNSPAAIKALDELGRTDLPADLEQLEQLQMALKFQDESEWLKNASTTWLYIYQPLLEAKGESYPAYMQTEAWNYKELNSALGSWAESQHDATIPSRLTENRQTHASLSSGPALAYVEPNPLAFYHLSYLAMNTTNGLSQRGLSGGSPAGRANLEQFLNDMKSLGERYRKLGDIAVKELQRQPLTDEDIRLIQSPLGALEEEFLQRSYADPNNGVDSQYMPPIPVISSATDSSGLTLHFGTGNVDRIYVIVPFNGDWWVAQGGVFSYFEFPFPREERLTDRQWRNLLTSDPPALPSWSEKILLPGGNPVDVLLFRIGDVYRITIPGSNLNLRKEPTRNAESVRKLRAGEDVLIVNGPVQAEGFTWWKLRVDPQGNGSAEGWAVENPDWYQRVY